MAVAATLTSYDELPYDSVPLPQAHPEYLAALAHLHGFAAPNPSRARVLELGCSSGGNLIPIAWYAPETKCLGIDLSRRQVEDGRRLIEAAEVSNVRILHADLSRPTEPLGEFDYVIAHGVFSWVPAPVQEAVFRLCAEHLAPNGIAYVSYNVFPGWQSRQALRSYLQRHVARIRDPADQVLAAQHALNNMAADWASNPLREFEDLKSEIAFLREASPSYLFHEYLANINEALTIGEFLSRAQVRGLDYLADASPGLCGRPGSMRLALVEQQFDEREMTRFRRSLLVRHGQPRMHLDAASALDALAFHANLQCEEEIDLDSEIPQNFQSPSGTTYVVRNPLSKAALIVLASTYPESIRFTDLLEAARGLIHKYRIALKESDAAQCLGEWCGLIWRHAVTPNRNAMAFFSNITPVPKAHSLARAQATLGVCSVAGAHNVALDVDTSGQELLRLLDGSNNRIALTGKMIAHCEMRGRTLSPEQVMANDDSLLQLFARNALLVG